MKVFLQRLVFVLMGAICGSMFTMLLLNERVDANLQSDFGRWSSILLFLLIGLLVIEWAAKRIWKQS